MLKNIAKGVLGVTVVGGILALVCYGVNKVLDEDFDFDDDIEDDEPEEKDEPKYSELDDEKLDKFVEQKIDEKVKEKLDKIVQERDRLITILDRQSRRNNGDMLVYYGCPNSKKISKLFTNKKKG